jgi:hypothetical protein
MFLKTINKHTSNTFFIFVIISLQISNILINVVKAQNSEKNTLQFNLNEQGTHYIKATFLNQTWIRYNWNNPGSSIYNIPEKETFDIGLRRTRFQLIGRINEQILFYSQFGINNFNYLSARKAGAFFHDALCEYSPFIKKLSIGGGLNGWSGPGRFSAPAVASFLGLDAPLFEQSTNDATDQFLRKLSIYAKGQLSKVAYQLIVSKPMVIQTSALYSPTLETFANFSPLPPQLQYHGYFSYSFFDIEDNLLPYKTGNYLGRKKIVNIGAGYLYQKKAMWYKKTNSDTAYSNLIQIATDLFIDLPLNKTNKTALNFYGVYFINKMGYGYIRSVGPMPPTNTLMAINSVNGSGSAFPMIGTGQTFYLQGGYLFKDSLFNKFGTMQWYASIQSSKFERLTSTMNVYETGINFLIKQHQSKITLAYQSRPYFKYNANKLGEEVKSARRGMLVCQYQISF